MKTLAIFNGTRYFVNGGQVFMADEAAEAGVQGWPFGMRFACFLEDWGSFKIDAEMAAGTRNLCSACGKLAHLDDFGRCEDCQTAQAEPQPCNNPSVIQTGERAGWCLVCQWWVETGHVCACDDCRSNESVTLAPDGAKVCKDCLNDHRATPELYETAPDVLQARQLDEDDEWAEVSNEYLAMLD